jgi:hypothetical protein
LRKLVSFPHRILNTVEFIPLAMRHADPSIEEASAKAAEREPG